jgi:hypothetical protein
MVNGYQGTAKSLTTKDTKEHKGLNASVILCVLCGKKGYFVAVTVLSAGAGYCGSFSRVRLAR